MRWSSRPHSRSEAVGRLLAAGLLAIACAFTPAHAARARFAVVASADVPVDNLSFAELRQLFLLERRYWKSGQPATMLFPPRAAIKVLRLDGHRPGAPGYPLGE